MHDVFLLESRACPQLEVAGTFQFFLHYNLNYRNRDVALYTAYYYVMR